MLAMLLIAVGCSESDTLADARALQEAGRFEESVPILKALVEKDPDDPEALYRYGQALSRSNLPSRAIWPLTEAMKNEQWTLRAALALARNGFRTHNYEEAIAAATIVLELEPEQEAALLLRAESRVRTRSREDYAGAIEDADLLLEINPDERRALVPRATALLALQRTDEAGEALEAIAEAFGTEGLATADAPRFCAARAKFATEKGETERAEEIYDECLESFPASAIVVQNAMEFFAALGRLDDATAVVKKAYETEPANRELRIAYALRQQQLGDLAGAEETLRAGAEVEQPIARAQAYQDLANFLGDQQRLDEAVEYYEKAHALIDRPSPGFLFDFADLLVRAERLDRALEVASDLRVHSQADIIRGRVQLARGEPEQALDSLSQGLRLWPNNAAARYLAAVAAEQTGRFDRAIEEYRYSIRVNADVTDARIRLARLLLAEGNFNLALVAIQHGRGRSEPDLDTALTELEIFASQRDLRSVPDAFGAAIRRHGARGRAIAAIARGTWNRLGPEGALAMIATAEGLDLASPANNATLRVYVDAALAADQSDGARQLLERTTRERKENALLTALLGRILAERGDLDGARVAATAALEIDPVQADALALRGDLLAKTDAEAALAAYDSGLAIDATDRDAASSSALARGRASLLAGRDRMDEAIEQLESHLREQPLDAAAARQLAGLFGQRARTGDDARSVRMAAWADRFDASTRSQAASADAQEDVASDGAGETG